MPRPKRSPYRRWEILVPVDLAQRFEALMPDGEKKRGGWRNAEVERALDVWVQHAEYIRTEAIKAKSRYLAPVEPTNEPEATVEDYELWRHFY